MGAPTVSVIIPVYNAALHLRECLDGVVNQTLKNIEIICVNDGSTDGSEKILFEYAEGDPRFLLLAQDNQGPGPARNLGLSRAQGEYLIFLDADDIFEPNLLESMVKRTQETQSDVTVCRSDAFDSNKGTPLPSDWLLKTERLGCEVFTPDEAGLMLFQFTHGWPWDKLLRTDFIRKHGLIYPSLPNSQDMVFIFPALALAKCIAVTEETLIHHRMNRIASVSNSRDRAMESPWQALCMCRKILQEKGCLDKFDASLLSWAMGFLIWHMGSMSDPIAQKRCYQLLRNSWFPQLRFQQYPIRNYPKDSYLKYCMIRVLPYRVYRMIRCYARQWRQ